MNFAVTPVKTGVQLVRNTMKTLDSGFRRNEVEQYQANFFTASRGELGVGAVELSKQKNYRQSFDLACASIQGMNLEERAKKAGADYEKGKDGEKITVHFFSEPYHILFPQIEFYSPFKKVVSLVTRILLLHYLIRADGSPLTGNWVAYKDIPGGLLYGGVFARRVTEPLQRRFGKSVRSFRETGIGSGGEPVEIGDASFIFHAFPYVPLQYVLWEGDEEFPPSVHLLFDASVDHYLALEDMVVLGQVTTGRLINRSKLSAGGSSCP